MRPQFRLLDDALVDRIIDEARSVLAELGMEIDNPPLVKRLLESGANLDPAGKRLRFPADLIDQALASAPSAFKLHDTLGEETHHFNGERVHFTPASAAILILDHGSDQARQPTSADYLRYVKLTESLEHITSQSTAFTPADVPSAIADAQRLYLSLRHGRKPVVTGAFGGDGYALMRELLLAVRGDAAALRAKPLAVFSVCPTAPLKWSRATSRNLVDCAMDGVPVEYISMPLAGFVGPVTLVGSLVQHTAETLSGIVLSQTVSPGAPALYGGCPAAFDLRYETTSLGAVETMMLDCAYVEVGKRLGLPTQAYIALSDAKLLDAQAGMETAMGATLAALAGIDNVSGPGVLDFITCMSLEKLVLDNELAGSALRLARGVEPREDFPALPHFRDLIAEGHLIIADHTRKHLRSEHFFPGPVIDRANRSRWRAEGGRSLGERAHDEVERRLAVYEPPDLAHSQAADLDRLMRDAAKAAGLDRLPLQDASPVGGGPEPRP